MSIYNSKIFRTKLIALTVLLFTVCGCNSGHPIEQPTKPAVQESGTMTPQVGNISSEKDLRYPHLPSLIPSPTGAIVLLPKAKSLAEIVSWGEKTYVSPLLFQTFISGEWTPKSHEPIIDVFLVMGVSNSGWQAYDVHIFAKNMDPSNSERPWILLYAHRAVVYPSRPYEIAQVHIDKNAKTVVFDNSKHVSIARLRFDSEMAEIRAWQDKAGRHYADIDNHT